MIVPTLARLLIREHQYKPIQGKVLILGRQTIAMTPEQLVELLQQEKISLSEDKLNKIGASRDKKTRYGKETEYVSDQDFFDIFKISELNIMDISDYEEADIIHDMNKPIPESLKNQFDFIIDGGTFDHLVDIRVAFENIVKMLKIGGRVFQWNAASNFTGAAYVLFGPDLFYDYYVLNQFADCKVYIAEIDNFGQLELWDFYEFEGIDKYDYFNTNRIQVTVVLSEKGSSSTWNRIPVQAQYREPHLWQAYRNGQKLLLSSGRKYFVGSRIRQELRSKSINPPKSLMGTFFLKLRKKGFIWVAKKIITMVNNIFLRKDAKKIKGFKYVGKI